MLYPSIHELFRELAPFSKEAASLPCSLRCGYQGFSCNSNIPLIRAIVHIKSFFFFLINKNSSYITLQDTCTHTTFSQNSLCFKMRIFPKSHDVFQRTILIFSNVSKLCFLSFVFNQFLFCTIFKEVDMYPWFILIELMVCDQANISPSFLHKPFWFIVFVHKSETWRINLAYYSKCIVWYLSSPFLSLTL